ncbi:MAG: hypothetical protein LBF94_03150 [Puniceicoccales bacterium]|jgi:lipopolysaccharide export system protein LptC|nr:hypothetical protein [Puniceicoccales bacterium]
MLHAGPEVVATSPARGLYVPIFDANGVKTWEITGSTGEVRDDGHIAVSNVLINRCGKDNSVIFFIESPQANVVPSSNIAAGDGLVLLRGKNFVAVAKNWKFFGKEKKFVANKDVMVVFDENVVEFVTP